MEDKKSKSPTKGKTEKTGAKEKKSAARKSAADSDSASAAVQGKTHADSFVVPSEPITLPSEWAGHGAIALVSHGALGGITVIHTEMPPGTQIQPIVTTDSTGASVISLDGSAIPFSIPVSMAHTIPLCSEASSTSLSIPTLSVPVSDGTSVSDIPTVSTSSVLEAAASQTILAPVSDSKAASEDHILQPDIQTVIVGEELCGREQRDGEKRTAHNPSHEPEGAPAQDAV